MDVGVVEVSLLCIEKSMVTEIKKRGRKGEKYGQLVPIAQE